MVARKDVQLHVKQHAQKNANQIVLHLVNHHAKLFAEIRVKKSVAIIVLPFVVILVSTAVLVLV